MTVTYELRVTDGSGHTVDGFVIHTHPRFETTPSDYEIHRIVDDIRDYTVGRVPGPIEIEEDQ